MALIKTMNNIIRRKLNEWLENITDVALRKVIRENIVITGGCDSMIGEFSVIGFDKIGALSKKNRDPEKASRPFDLKRDGFVLGEGSGILILEELTHAQKRNAPILAEVAGYGSSSNAYRLTASPENGHGADRDTARRNAARRRHPGSGRAD